MRKGRRFAVPSFLLREGAGAHGFRDEPLSAVMAGLDPAIQVGASKSWMRRAAAIFVEHRRLDGRVKPGHDARRVTAIDSKTL